MANQKDNRTTRRLDPILSSKDRDALYFLWRHRIATFRGLKTVFYPELSNEQAYYHLRRLRRGQYVRVEKADGTRNKVWCLDQRGFRYLVSVSLPELKVKTYKPQRAYHDLMASAVLLGHWAIKQPSNVKLLSEQEMVALELVELPRELRKEREHQPDGIWIFNSGGTSKAIALEVELSGKSSERYEQICSFYTSQIFFENIIWIVECKSLAQKILECSRRHGIPREGIHLFILQKTFEELGWDSTFLNESMGSKSLGNVLTQMAGLGNRIAAPPLVRHESASNPPSVPQRQQNPFLDFSFSLGNLSILRNRQGPTSS